MLRTQNAQTCAARDAYASVQASQPSKAAVRQTTPADPALLSALDMQLTKFCL